MSGKNKASDSQDEMDIPLVTKAELEMLGLTDSPNNEELIKHKKPEDEPEEEKPKKPEEEPCEFEVKPLKNGGVFFEIPNFSEYSHLIMSPKGILAVPKDRDQWEVPYPYPGLKKKKPEEDKPEENTENAKPPTTVPAPSATPLNDEKLTLDEKKNLIAMWQKEFDADDPAGSKTVPPTGDQEEFTSADPNQFGKLLLKEAKGLTGKI